MEDRDNKKKDILLRLRRIEGQVRGLQRMVGEEAACADVLTQVAAATAAMKKVGRAIVQGYMSECLEKDWNRTAKSNQGKWKELQDALSRYIDWA